MFFRYRFCVQKGWDRFGEDLLQMRHMLTSQGSNASLTNNACTVLKPATCRWKQIYIRALSLDKNWEQGRYSVAPLLRGHKDPITCMACDGKCLKSFWVVIELKGKLRGCLENCSHCIFLKLNPYSYPAQFLYEFSTLGKLQTHQLFTMS